MTEDHPKPFASVPAFTEAHRRHERELAIEAARTKLTKLKDRAASQQLMKSKGLVHELTDILAMLGGPQY